MRFPSKLAMTLLLLVLSVPAKADPFVNLDFEQATVPPGTGQTLNAGLAFPGWTPRIGSILQTDVSFNYPGAGEAGVILYDQPLIIGGFPVLQGHFSIALHTDYAYDVEASLTQTGDVPLGTQSLRFLSPRNTPPVVVAMNGNVLPLVRLPNPGSFHFLWGADVTSFAGSSVELRLSSVHPPNGLFGAGDAFAFSPDPIPEPSSFLVTVSILGLTNVIRRRVAFIN